MNGHAGFAFVARLVLLTALLAGSAERRARAEPAVAPPAMSLLGSSMQEVPSRSQASRAKDKAAEAVALQRTVVAVGSAQGGLLGLVGGGLHALSRINGLIGILGGLPPHIMRSMLLFGIGTGTAGGVVAGGAVAYSAYRIYLALGRRPEKRGSLRARPAGASGGPVDAPPVRSPPHRLAR